METITIKRGRDSIENIDDYKSEKLESLKGSLKHLEKSIDVYTDVLNIAGSKGISVYSEIDINTICDITKAISDMNGKIHCSHMLVQQKHPEVANEAFELSETSKSSEDFNGQLKGILSDEENDDINLDLFSENPDTLSIQGQKDIEEFRSITFDADQHYYGNNIIWVNKVIDGLKKLGENPELTIKIPMISRYKNSLIEFKEQTERVLLLKSNTLLKKKAILEDISYAKREYQKAMNLFFESLKKFGFPAF